MAKAMYNSTLHRTDEVVNPRNGIGLPAQKFNNRKSLAG